jgi:DHA1 family multidrug resistance protein-like MFS transporter
MTTNTIRPFITRRLVLFFLGIACIEATRAMTMVQIPIFLREIGASVSQVGFFFTFAMIFPLVLRIIGGWYSDRIGRLKALLLGSIAGMAAYLPYIVADRWEITLLGPTILAVSTALTLPSYQAFVADTIPEGARGRIFGIGMSFRTAAWIIAPPLGGTLALLYGSRWTFAFATALFALATLIYALLHWREPKEVRPSAKDVHFQSLRGSVTQVTLLILSGGLLTWVVITDGIKDITYQLSFDLMPVYLSEIASISKQGVGFLDGIHGLAWLIASPIGGIIADRASERIAATMGLILLLASPLTFAFATEYRGFALSWVLMGIGGALFDPAINTLLARGVNPSLRGIAYGLVATSIGLVSLFSPWIGSLLWESLGPRAPYLITVILGSLAIIPAWFKLQVPGELVAGGEGQAVPRSD